MKNPLLLPLAFLCISLVACTGTGDQEETQTAGYSTPEEQGISSTAIMEFIGALESEQPEDVHGVIIRRHNKIVAKGWWAPYSEEIPHMLFSLSKSFTSTAIGMAQDEGLLSINDPVISFFPDETPDSPSVNLSSMRIRDLLRMNTGHQSDATGRIRSGGSWVKGFLSLEVENKPGTRFAYNSAATYMMSAIIQKITGETVLDFLTPRLFEPLGIENPTWESSPEGINAGGWGLSIRTGDISNFGQMLLQKGNWEGRQLVSEAWVKEATRLQTSNGSNPGSDWEQGYGYQFWMCRHNLYRGDGAMGQYCIVMPEQDAVVAINSGTNNMGGIMNIVWDHLLPAMEEGPLPPNEEGYKKLTEKLESLTIQPAAGEGQTGSHPDVSGKSFRMGPNDLAIGTIRFDFGSSPVTLTLTGESSEYVVHAGDGNWKEGTLPMPGWISEKLSASGAWTSANSYTLKTVYRETPYIVTHTFTFDNGELTWEMERNVGNTPGKSQPVSGKPDPSAG